VQARGTGCDGGALVLDVVVSRTPATDPDVLPRTGSDNSVELGQIGLALVAAGGVALFAARRRQLAKTNA
jgi:LPXTG-motif cell wall-anchored protein